MCSSGDNSDLIGCYPRFAGNQPPGLCTRKLLPVESVFPSLSFCLESPIPLASSGRPSPTDSPSVNAVRSTRRLDRETTPLGRNLMALYLGMTSDKDDVAAVVELETSI